MCTCCMSELVCCAGAGRLRGLWGQSILQSGGRGSLPLVSQDWPTALSPGSASCWLCAMTWMSNGASVHSSSVYPPVKWGDE